MLSRTLRLLAVVLLIAAALPIEAAKTRKLKAKDVMLPRGWPAVTEAQKSLSSVAYAPGAPAVVLVEAEQNEWESINLEFKRLRYFRRVKILTEDGIADHGSFAFTLLGNWRVQKVNARTILPDGQVIDAADNVNREKSEDGYEVVKVSFPQVQVGSIIDFDLHVNTDAFRVDPWTLQGKLPVLDSRFILIPPIGLRYRTLVARMPPELNKPAAIPWGPGGKAYAWRFTDVPALPDIANLPPLSDVSQRLFVILEAYKTENVFLPLASDWKTWNERLKKSWDDWMKASHAKADALARQVAGDKAGPVEKAEAIRLALRERFDVTWISKGYTEDSADDLLESGSGTSGDLAALVTVMLRSLGEQADLAAIRRRSDGVVPIGFPTPALLNDLMVRLRRGEEHIFFSPGSDLHVTRLPYDCSGVLAMPYDGTTEQPVMIPDFSARENRTLRTVESKLSREGDLEATSTETYSGPAAELWRNRLRDLNDERRAQRTERALRAYMPEATQTSLEIENLDDASKDLILRRTWEVPGFATVAGKRVIFNPNLFERILATDWAPDSRQYEINLGTARESIDTMMLTMPDGVADIQVPDRAQFEAGPVGMYETSYQRRGQMLIAKRHMLLKVYRFSPQSYPGLKKWFTDIAASDDKPIVLQLN